MGSETHANQFSIPYIKDSKGNTAYTLYADGNWSSYKSHVNGKNTLEAGKISVDKWQDIRMDMDEFYNMDATIFEDYINVGKKADSISTLLKFLRR